MRRVPSLRSCHHCIATRPCLGTQLRLDTDLCFGSDDDVLTAPSISAAVISPAGSCSANRLKHRAKPYIVGFIHDAVCHLP